MTEFYFTIALRSKASTNNWDSVVHNFNRTLSSILGQTDKNFKVYIGCNDIPETDFNNDERVCFITVNTPKPKDWLDGCRDRDWKQLVCCNRIYEENKSHFDEGGGLFVFPVDADDYVNRHIVEYVLKNRNANGFKSPKGYRYYVGKRFLELSPYYGGTMNVMKLFCDDMPTVLPNEDLAFDKSTCVQLNEKYPVRWNDIEVEQKFASLGRKFDAFPFISTVYVLGTGDNISVFDPNNVGGKKVHLGALIRKLNPLGKVYLTNKIKKEFGML